MMTHRWPPAVLAALLAALPLAAPAPPASAYDGSAPALAPMPAGTASPVARAPVPAPSPSASAAAAPAMTWAIQPSSASGPTGRGYFVHDATPGQRIDDHAAISNLGRDPLSITLYGTDAFNTADGAFALLPASQPPTGAGAWVRTGRRQVEVAPGQRVIVPFQLVVPTNATPGDHAGGLVASVVSAGTDAAGRQVALDRRVVARIYLRVAGPIHPSVQVTALRVDNRNPVDPLAGGQLTARYRLRNTGNVRIGGTGRMTVRGPFGWHLANTGTIEIPELLPGGEIEVSEQVRGLPPAGRLEVAVVIEPATMDIALAPVTRTTGVWAVPWVLVAVLVVLGAVLALHRLRARRGTRRSATPAGSVSTDAGGPESGPADSGPADTVAPDTTSTSAGRRG